MLQNRPLGSQGETPMGFSKAMVWATVLVAMPLVVALLGNQVLGLGLASTAGSLPHCLRMKRAKAVPTPNISQCHMERGSVPAPESIVENLNVGRVETVSCPWVLYKN